MATNRRNTKKWKNLFLVRHGESTCNEVNRFAGMIDAPLTELGEAQARQAAGHWRGKPPEIVLTSPLQRARRTAEILFPQATTTGWGNTTFMVDKGISERHFGDFTLQNKAFIQREVGLREYEAALYSDCPAMSGGESFAEFHYRVLKFLQDVLHPLLVQGKRVLVVAHKYVIELLCRLILRLPASDGYDLRLPNGKILPGAGLWSYVRKESQNINLLQEWIVLHHSLVLSVGVATGILLRYVNLLTTPSPLLTLFILSLATGISLARVDLNSFNSSHMAQIAIKPMIIRYALMPLALGTIVFLGCQNTGIFFLAMLLAAPSAITGITISRCMGGMVSSTVYTILLSTTIGTVAILALLAIYGMADLAGPAGRLLLIAGLGLMVPVLAVRCLRKHHPIGTANFAERNGATAIILLTLFVILSFGEVELESFWPDAAWALLYAALLRLIALALVRRRSIYAVDDYISMGYPNIFFVVVLASMLGLKDLLGMATWFLLPMFALAPFDEWLCKKFLSPMQDARLLSFLKIHQPVEEGGSGTNKILEGEN